MTGAWLDAMVAWIGAHPVAAGGLVFLVANSDSDNFSVPGLSIPLYDARAGTLILIGIVLGLAATYGRDVLKAFDNTASTVEAPMVTPPQRE